MLLSISDRRTRAQVAPFATSASPESGWSRAALEILRLALFPILRLAVRAGLDGSSVNHFQEVGQQVQLLRQRPRMPCLTETLVVQHDDNTR